MLAGLTGGIIIGALPGLSATMGVALMVPATFAMNPTSGLIMLGAIYAGAIYGGANSAILICTPGTPSSVATTFDGWPLCQKGRADLGLYTSLLSSAFGGIVGTLFLLCLGGSLARFALQFGGPESFWLCLFGLSTIAVMTPDNMGKGIVSGAVGILVSTIGLDPNTGAPRFTFGTYDLLQGVSVIPCMIGLFSFSQVLYLIGTDKSFIAEYHPHKGAFGKVFRYLAAHCKTILVRSSVLGTWIGMLPGAGGEIASIISYNESKRWDKDPSRYGKGSLEGVAAAESGNNAVCGGALIGLSLGIIFAKGATTGGTDLIARLVKLKLPWISMGNMLLVIDTAVVVLVALAFGNLTTALYGFIAQVVCAYVTDMVLYGLDTAKVAYIISEKAHEISDSIVGQMDRGVTVLPGKGAYSGENKLVLMCAFKQKEIVNLKEIIFEIDPKAFIIVCDAHEVTGNGFKTYQKNDI